MARVARPNPFDPLYRAAAGLCVVVAVAGVVVGVRGSGVDERDTVEWFAETAAGAVVLTAAGLAALRWRVAGSVRALWTAVALALLGGLGVGVGDLLPLVVDTPPALGSLASAATIGAATLLVHAARQPEIDVAATGPRAVLLAAAWTATLAVALLVAGVEGITPFVTLPSSEPTLLALDAVLWTVAAAACALRSRRDRGDWTLAWVALLAGAMALNHVTFVAASLADLVVIGTPRMLLLVGGLLAVRGAAKDLHLAFIAQRAELWRSKVNAETARARVTADRAAAGYRAHEARNALAALGGAVDTLERYRDRLSDEARESLAAAATRQIARLQSLVSRDASTERAAPFPVLEALAPAITSARSLGLAITVDVEPTLEAVGRYADTAQAIQGVFDLLRRHGSVDAQLRTAADGKQVTITVADPGAPGSDAGPAAAGAGSIGFEVARRLMTEQGGDLQLDLRNEHGVAFVATLPVDEPSVSGGVAPLLHPAVDAGDQLIEVGDHDHIR